MAKKIEWLDKFANDQYKKMTKTASRAKIANQIIVDRSMYPNVKVGSLVDYDNNKYKVVDTKYRDKSGPGLLLEEVTACNCGPNCSDSVQTNTSGVVPATTEVKNPTNTKTAAKNDFDFDALADFDDSKFNLDSKDDDLDLDTDDSDDNDDFNFDESSLDLGKDEEIPALSGNTGYSEYPDVITRPGGNKPIASADIEGPGKKNVTDAPYHPTFDPGEQYALESLDEWQDAADRTASAIKQEDEQDRTTVEGHYTWNQYIDAILDENPAEAINDVELPADPDAGADADDTDDEDFSFDDDVDTDEDFGADADIDADTDADVDTSVDDGDEIDTAVNSMLDDEDNDSSDIDDFDFNDDFDTNTDADSSIDNDNDNDIDLDMDNTDEDIPEDFSDENLPENDFDVNDDEEQNRTAKSQFKNKQLSRLAFKNQ